MAKRLLSVICLTNDKMRTEKVTIRLPEQLLRDIDMLIKLGEFSTRSDAIRIAIYLLIDKTLEKLEKKEKWYEAAIKRSSIDEMVDKLRRR